MGGWELGAHGPVGGPLGGLARRMDWRNAQSELGPRTGWVQRADQNSSRSPPIHIPISADLNTTRRSRGRVLLWRTIANLILFSADAILMNSYHIYKKKSDYMNLDAGDNGCYGRSFSMEQKNG